MLHAGNLVGSDEKNKNAARGQREHIKTKTNGANRRTSTVKTHEHHFCSFLIFRDTKSPPVSANGLFATSMIPLEYEMN
ncbi:unnamed protein product, partial [Amoebophrya sp. A120]